MPTASRPWITHASAQSSNFDLHRLRQDFRKPLVYDEIGYEGNVKESWGNLLAQELVRRFWVIATQGGYPGHSEVYYNPEESMWWNKGGRMVGESVERIAFLKRLIESGPDRGISCCPPSMAFCKLGKKSDDWILGYTDTSQPRELEVRLPAGKTYTLRIFDTWAMTETRHPDPIVANGEATVVPLPGKPCTAFLLEAARTGNAPA